MSSESAEAKLERHPLFLRVLAEVLPRLETSRQRLSAQMPAARISLFSGSVGAATSFQGAQVGIECSLPGVADTAPDNVALIVALCHLDRQPRLDASVAWGHPSGKVEAGLPGAEGSSDAWPFATEERIRELLNELPRMIQIFEAAAVRGQPQ